MPGVRGHRAPVAFEAVAQRRKPAARALTHEEAPVDELSAGASSWAVTERATNTRAPDPPATPAPTSTPAHRSNRRGTPTPASRCRWSDARYRQSRPPDPGGEEPRRRRACRPPGGPPRPPSPAWHYASPPSSPAGEIG